jgi:hypothetical protein
VTFGNCAEPPKEQNDGAKYRQGREEGIIE